MNSRQLTTTQKDLLVGLAAIAVVVSLALIGYALKTSTSQRDTLNRQVTFLCSTTSILDKLVVDSARTNQTDLKNGTYTRLLKAGLITPEFIAQAKREVRIYNRAHRDLVGGENGACTP